VAAKQTVFSCVFLKPWTPCTITSQLAGQLELARACYQWVAKHTLAPQGPGATSSVDAPLFAFNAHVRVCVWACMYVCLYRCVCMVLCVCVSGGACVCSGMGVGAGVGVDVGVWMCGGVYVSKCEHYLV